MKEPIDRKFTFCATCCEHGHEHSHMAAMVFLAKDKALPSTLQFYRDECFRLGAKEGQMVGIRTSSRSPTWISRTWPASSRRTNHDLSGQLQRQVQEHADVAPHGRHGTGTRCDSIEAGTETGMETTRLLRTALRFIREQTVKSRTARSKRSDGTRSR